ncbi:MAG: hypothetical protein H0X24_15915 [Ktedonobacterales bacterium]|nr:hypothetical protein [Ktedonobacterales bacterium]
MASQLAVAVTDARHDNLAVVFTANDHAPLVQVDMSAHPKLIINRAIDLDRPDLLALLIDNIHAVLRVAEQFHVQQENALIRAPLFG